MWIQNEQFVKKAENKPYEEVSLVLLIALVYLYGHLNEHQQVLRKYEFYRHSG